MSGHLKLVVILTIFLVTLALILGNTLYGGTPAFAMFTPIGMGVLTILVHRMMMNADKISPQRFLIAFMGGVSVKMFVSLIVLAIYLHFATRMRAEMAIWFFLVYVLFTAFEVLWMQRYLRSGSEK
jgi:hypothetical protein